MPAILQSVLHQDLTLTAGTRVTTDLPVNPLSFIALTLRARDTGVVTAARSPIATFLALLSNIRVAFKGADQWNGSALDLFALNVFLLGITPRHNVMENTATAVRFATLIIPFTRRPFWTDECFPATRKGELQLIIDPAASFAGFDTVSLQTETYELLDVQPARYIKTTTIARTFPATGQNDIDLPLGNPLLGALLFGTTFPTGGVFTASFGQVAIMLDNVQFTYTTTNWETLQSLMLGLRHGSAYSFADHTHVENLAAAYAQNAESEVARQARDPLRQYAYLDWDPLMDSSYALQTEGRGSVRLRATADVADAVRVLPIELVALQPIG
jgi:hypothetical protein